jgi:transcriptional regulator with XRE-family HTH domain
MPRETKNPTDIHVGARVRELRVKRGLSQGKVAELIGLSFQQFQKYEKGINRIGSSRLHQVAQILGVEAAYFFEDAPRQIGPAAKARPKVPADLVAVTQFIASKDGRALAQAFARLGHITTRRTIVRLVEALAERQTRRSRSIGPRSPVGQKNGTQTAVPQLPLKSKL